MEGLQFPLTFQPLDDILAEWPLGYFLIIRKGEQVGIPTPVNRVITEVMHRVDEGELKAGPENLKLFEEYG